MTSLFALPASWFINQSHIAQLVIVGCWSFFCGIILSATGLRIVHQKQKDNALNRQASITDIEKRALADRIASDARMYDSVQYQYDQITAEKVLLKWG